MRETPGSELAGLGTIAAFGVISFLLFFFLLIVPPFITATLLVIAVVAALAFYLWHWATRAHA